jgi:hypothetical protein
VAPDPQRRKTSGRRRPTLSGAICPKAGKAAGLVLPHCDTAAMSLHLAEIAAAVAPGAHAVLLLDRAGWHLSDRLEVATHLRARTAKPTCPFGLRTTSTLIGLVVATRSPA